MKTRRGFLQGSAGGALAALGVRGAPLPASAWSGPDSGSDIGSLYPFVKSQAVAGEFPLSFLQEEFSDLRAWKAKARAKVLELLHYAPPPCDPRAEVVERVDRGDYVRGKGPLQHHARRPRSRVRPGSQEGEGARARARRSARPRRVLRLGQGEAGRAPGRAPGAHGFQAAALWGPQHRERAGARRVRGGRDRHVLLGRAPHAAGRRPGRLARASRKPHPRADRGLQPTRRRVRAARRSHASKAPGSPGRA